MDGFGDDGGNLPFELTWKEDGTLDTHVVHDAFVALGLKHIILALLCSKTLDAAATGGDVKVQLSLLAPTAREVAAMLLQAAQALEAQDGPPTLVN